MLRYCTSIFILVIFEIIFIKCLIPNANTLSVRQVDSKLIERKRMDTLEMCKIFENERLKEKEKRQPRRGKREISAPKFGGVPTLREEDVNRVESIVDKLYDDLTENGRPVTYRQRELKTTTKIKKLNEDLFNQSSRRFDFAPQFLLGPEPSSSAHSPPETVPGIPWIKQWKHGIIPYFIDPKTYDNGLAETIMTAFDYFERATCIRLQRLREKPTDKLSLQMVEWVYISNPMGIRQCVHSNEWIPNKGVQMVVFGYDCMSTGEIVHEVMHILGFSHEHNRPDRDRHVSIMWDNIKPGYKKYFEMRSQDALLRLPYDFLSVLHYPPRAFSKNGQITVSAKAGVKIGQREGLSETDVEKVALIFGNECVDRNKEYLLTTCPSVVKTKAKTKVATQNEIQHYFKGKIWDYGIVNYKFADHMEFSAEERENIQAVIKHIEKETCIEFQDMEAKDNSPEDDKDDEGNDEEKGEENTEGNDDVDNELKDDGNNDGKTKGNDIEDGGEAGKENPKSQLKDIKLVAEELGEDPTTDGIPKETTTEEQKKRLANKQSTDQGKEMPGAIVSLEVDPVAGEDAVGNETAKRRSKGFKSSHLKARVKRSPMLMKPEDFGKMPFTRRHASNVLVFKRSTDPGCKCPPPGGKLPEEDGKESVIELNADCFNSVNDLLHVFVHILGLEHQHNMHDRDDFLHIVWEKLTPEVKKEMEQKLPPAAAVGFPYDYQSVMHYPWLQIKDGVTNIMYPIWNDGWAMGHWQGLSSTDVQKLSLLYFEQCLERKKHEASDVKEEKL